jgi:phage I-like protein
MPNPRYLIKLDDFQFDATKPDSGWLHVFSLGSVTHPLYGEFELTPERIANFADNVNNNVLGTDVPIDYSHGRGPDGERAAGWSTLAEARDNGLWLFVDWTPPAASEIRNKQWKYSSAEFTDTWTDQQGHKYQDVLLAAAITNRPFLKDLTPINLSEFSEDELVNDLLDDDLNQLLEHFELASVDNSAWDGNAAMTNCKSASDYRAICAGRRAGDPSERKTWALPHHKTPGAPPNKAGVTAALQRFNQTQGLVNKDGARRHLEAHQNAMKAMSDSGGDMDIKLLASFFGLGEDSTEDQVLAKAKEVGAAFAAKQSAEEKAKTFAEQFPEQAAELAESKQRLADLAANNRLAAINNDISKLLSSGVPTKFADEIREFRQSLTDDADAKFGALLQEIVTEGLVPLTEGGSSAAGHGDNEDKTFADVINAIQDEHSDWTYKQVYSEAKKQEPELEKAYTKVPAGAKGGE